MAVRKIVAIALAVFGAASLGVPAHSQSRLENEIVVRYARFQLDNSRAGKIWFQFQNNSRSDWRVKAVSCDFLFDNRTLATSKTFAMSVVVLKSVPLRESDPLPVDFIPTNGKISCHISDAVRCDSGKC